MLKRTMGNLKQQNNSVLSRIKMVNTYQCFITWISNFLFYIIPKFKFCVCFKNVKVEYIVERDYRLSNLKQSWYKWKPTECFIKTYFLNETVILLLTLVTNIIFLSSFTLPEITIINCLFSISTCLDLNASE